MTLPSPEELRLFSHWLQIMFAGIFFYHAFLIQRISRSEQGITYTGLAPMSLAAAAYYLFFESYWLPLGTHGVRIAAHLVWITGSLMIYFHITAVEAYLNARSRWVKWCKCLLQANVALPLVSLFLLLGWDRMFLFSAQPMTQHTPLILPERVRSAFSPGLVTSFLGCLLALVEITCFAYFFQRVVRRRVDLWLAFGLLLTLAAVLNEIYAGIRPHPYAFSFLFLANFVEIARLTALIDRVNREKILRAEHSMKLAQIGEVSAAMAHELSNPLSVILSYTHMGLHSELPEDLSYRTILERVDAAAKRMASVARTLRDHARMPQAKSETFDLGKAARDAADLITSTYAREGITVTTSIPDQLPPVSGDAGRFLQVLLNLLQNARDATEGRPSRRITLSASASDERVLLRVADNGSGIEPSLMDRIFSPFFTTKPRGQGTGIGLSLVASQIKAMQGEIQVRSDPGQGTVFEISLPPAKTRS